MNQKLQVKEDCFTPSQNVLMILFWICIFYEWICLKIFDFTARETHWLINNVYLFELNEAFVD